MFATVAFAHTYKTNVNVTSNLTTYNLHYYQFLLCNRMSREIFSIYEESSFLNPLISQNFLLSAYFCTIELRKYVY